MDPDKYQQAWQAHSSQTRVTIHADLLRKEVQRHQRSFRNTIFWRDIREVGGSLIMLPIWFYLGSKLSLPWSWYLTVPALLWVAGFMLVDRIRNRKKSNPSGDTLIESVKCSLVEVEHQIWLLQNVFWWYLLPFCISIMAFFAHVGWLSSNNWWEFLAFVGALGLFLFLIYGGVYVVNQNAVRKQLEPRRQELLQLLASLSDDANAPSGSAAEVYDIVPASVSPFTTEASATPSGTGVRSALAMLCVLPMVVLAIVLVDQVNRRSNSRYDGVVQSSGVAGDSLANLIVEQRDEKQVVGLAAMIMIDGEVEAAAAHGERKAGSGVPVQVNDRWHLGGIAKSMTATMIARLVEAGQMQWTDTLGDIFPNASMHKEWRAVTLKQLLTDTAGAPRNFPSEVRRQRPAFGSECKRARRKVVLDIIADEPTYPPGSRNEYSNVGVVIASAMAEEVTDTSWKELLEQEIYVPLELSGAGFGPPKSSDGTLEQPRGHRARLAGKIAVEDDVDNTPIMGPSAAVHMTLQDLCVFANEHMQGERGEGKLLSAESYKVLHTPVRNQYAFGWIQWEPGGRFPYVGGTIPGKLYWHNGSNTMWHALVVFVPEKNIVVAVTSNDGDELAEIACWKIVKDILSPSPHDNDSEGFARRSPFHAVRWNESKPEVKLNGEWYELISLNSLPVGNILAFSRETYGIIWRKRFEEDLVELLTRMGHPPGDEVTLEVRSLKTSEVWTRENVPMTEANRQAIWDAANGF